MKFSNSQIDAILYGKFRVKYKDDQVSVRMYYRTAKDYASIFGGEILDDF